MPKIEVPFLDLEAGYRELANRAEPAILQSFRSGRYILGPDVERFEAQFAEYCDARYAVGVANGLDALRLALLAVGVGPGDKVMVPSHTYIATWLAVSACGATPVPVEPDPLTYNITAKGIRATMETGMKAVIPVHLYGQPADIEAIVATAAELDLKVIEDAAQAHGARWSGRRIGGHGDAVCWSFYPGKNLGGLGDGGGVTTNSPEIADRIRLLRNYGSRLKYHHETLGLNSRLDPVQAAFLSVKLQVLDEWNARREMIAARYMEAFSNTRIVLPTVTTGANHAWHLFVIRTPDRGQLAAKLSARGIGTLVHYPIPPHLQKAYKKPAEDAWDLPIATKLADEVLSLPIGPHLTNHQVDQVIQGVLESL